MTELLLGMSLGLGAGVTPGPLLGLVLVSTLQRGRRAGLQVAMSPLVTDGPIITVVLLVLHSLPDRATGLLAIAGGLYVGWLAVSTLTRVRGADIPVGTVAAPRGRDLWRASLANVLSPHPWLFWIGIGGPILLHAWQRSPWRGIWFLAGMFGLLVGSKMLLATLVAAARGRVNPRGYRLLLALAATLMLATAVAVIVQFRHAAFAG